MLVHKFCYLMASYKVGCLMDRCVSGIHLPPLRRWSGIFVGLRCARQSPSRSHQSTTINTSQVFEPNIVSWTVDVRKLNSTLISFHLYFMFYSLIFAMYVLGLDIPKKHHMLEKQILEMQTVWKRRPLERHTVSLRNQLSVPKLWSP